MLLENQFCERSCRAETVIVKPRGELSGTVSKKVILDAPAAQPPRITIVRVQP